MLIWLGLVRVDDVTDERCPARIKASTSAERGEWGKKAEAVEALCTSCRQHRWASEDPALGGAEEDLNEGRDLEQHWGTC